MKNCGNGESGESNLNSFSEVSDAGVNALKQFSTVNKSSK